MLGFGLKPGSVAKVAGTLQEQKCTAEKVVLKFPSVFIRLNAQTVPALMRSGRLLVSGTVGIFTSRAWG